MSAPVKPIAIKQADERDERKGDIRRLVNEAHGEQSGGSRSRGHACPPPPPRSTALPTHPVRTRAAPRAADLQELYNLQKTTKAKDGAGGASLRAGGFWRAQQWAPPGATLPHPIAPLRSSPPPPPPPPHTEKAEETKAASISVTLKSTSREAGPRVVHREPKHLYVPQSPRSRAAAEAEQTELIKEMFHEMSECESRGRARMGARVLCSPLGGRE